VSAADRAAIVVLLRAVSDDGGRYEGAPFDHPELYAPVGVQQVDALPLVLDTSDPHFQLIAADRWAGLPAVGKAGGSIPLQTFEELLQGMGSDGSRAQSLQDRCPIS
jgi:hypothetical protein